MLVMLNVAVAQSVNMARASCQFHSIRKILSINIQNPTDSAAMADRITLAPILQSLPLDIASSLSVGCLVLPVRDLLQLSN